ncbi:hypothetical protein D0T50_08410 [Bacteroides sp. 214]|nr:hypothetical protein [Bacteroides sp. 214]
MPGFITSPYFEEQVLAYTYFPDALIEINAPSVKEFDLKKPTAIVMYGLPNGNTIDWTIGKKASDDGNDDWHYQIQHIGAQTRFVRAQKPDYNLVTVYLQAKERSWGAWRRNNQDSNQIIKDITEDVMSLFAPYNPYIILSGHSGGGNFVFGFIESVQEIPSYVKRISFLDSNYNWDETKYGAKIVDWLNASSENALSVIAYNDSVAIYEGKPVVSPTGGTWYRSKCMHEYLKENLPAVEWTESRSNDLLSFNGAGNRIQFLLKDNPACEILHTVLVEKNGFIQTLYAGTPREERTYAFYGEHAYDAFIQSDTVFPHILRIPPRKTGAIKGSEFIEKVKNMFPEEREKELYSEISAGNIPNSHRQPVRIKETLTDADGASHQVEFEVLPDFLSIGADDDFFRIPMLPGTAQQIADLFGAVLPTSKISDIIHKHAKVKMNPSPMTPDETMTTVPVFAEHDRIIEQERLEKGEPLSSLIAGHKKDIVISNKLIERPNAVVIYGWHYPEGKRIQPTHAGHSRNYVDYSHGVRLINNEILLDGVNVKIQDVLKDPVMYKLLSDEDAPLASTGYHY